MEMVHLRIDIQDLEALQLMAITEHQTVQSVIRRIVHEAVSAHRDAMRQVLEHLEESEKHHV